MLFSRHPVLFLRPLADALYGDARYRHHVSTADVLSLEGHLSRLVIAASNQRYRECWEQTLSNDVVILS
jgi:hypothetical protein